MEIIIIEQKKKTYNVNGNQSIRTYNSIQVYEYGTHLFRRIMPISVFLFRKQTKKKYYGDQHTLSNELSVNVICM